MSDKTPNDILMANMNMHEHVVILGITKDGKLHMETNRPTYEFMNYILNRSIFNLNLLENNQQVQQTVAEQKVRDAVDDNVAQQVQSKRGRPRKSVE